MRSRVPDATSLVIDGNVCIRVGGSIKDLGAAYSEGGLIAVHVPAGHQHIEIVYRPTHILWAYLLTFVATVVLVAVWLIEKKTEVMTPARSDPYSVSEITTDGIEGD